MSKLIKVAAGVLNQTPLDWKNNKQNILQSIEEARKKKVSILCLPELCITGYGCEDMFYAPSVHRKAMEILHEIAPETRNMIVSVGLPITVQNKIFNAACLLVNGKIAGFVAKKFLAGEGIHYEPRWFMPWRAGEKATIEVEINEKVYSYPVGDYFFNCGGIKIGFEICEDAWVANRPGRDLATYGIDIILNPSASHFAFGKLEIRKRFVLEGSRAFAVSYLYANLLGNEAGRAIYDGGAMIASNGVMLNIGSRFSFKDFEITTATIDVELTRMAQGQSRAPFVKVEQAEACINVDFYFPPLKPEKPIEMKQEAWEKSPFLKEEEFTRAISLALYDYLRKSRAQGFVVSLSGGADSTAVACLCYLAIELGIADIGYEAFIRKLDYIPDIRGFQTVAQLTNRLLTCAYQATKNSSQTTFHAAQTIANWLQATFMNLDIDNIVEEYKILISNQIGRKLSWDYDDIALQNIQARVRSPSIWLIANLKNALLLSTSNRSEAAVGYATMDGDTSGGLSPIAGIDKHFLRQWLVWLEKEGVEGILTLPELSLVTKQAPTAELRPQESKQTDEDDLMPYHILDDIEEQAIRDKKTPIQCYQFLKAKYSQYSDSQLKLWTERFFKLWCRNQWKRERYAPSFHVDDKNLDPKTWCRFPILSGGFEEELEALRNYAE
ncbi:MAG: NAD(+) synthase [Microscillaceae bacterium]|nr:NAD(+) synthase [Microscillaceae bacterium]MDW8461479.1 NAD(+) synthase [Cytophagales bacterium]